MVRCSECFDLTRCSIAVKRLGLYVTHPATILCINCYDGQRHMRRSILAQIDRRQRSAANWARKEEKRLNKQKKLQWQRQNGGRINASM